jgi:hypothetical protein
MFARTPIQVHTSSGEHVFRLNTCSQNNAQRLLSELTHHES